jgi:LacI family transcriptional regulator
MQVSATAKALSGSTGARLDDRYTRKSGKMVVNKQVTIRQVASRAGVSTQTVSRVINDRPDVSPDTRRKVQRVINEMGYRPNAIARSLIHRRSFTLGVEATGLDHFGPLRTLIGIEKQTRSLGYSLLLDLLHHPELVDVEYLLDRLLSQQVDGILWAVPEIGENRSKFQRAVLRIPVPIICMSMNPHPRLTTVSVDNRSGGRMACAHLIEQGSRNIGLITGPLEWWEARQRQLGWQDALRDAGLPAGEKQIVEGDWSAASGAEGMRRLLEQFPEIDAVFVSNDQMALGALQYASQVGKQVPRDLAVVGFDDTPESAYFCPSLTTIRQDLIELGSTAVSKLGHLIDAHHKDEQAGKPQTILIQPELVVRESSLKV